MIPIFCAVTTAWVRLLTCRVRKRALMCSFTVDSETPDRKSVV